MNIQPCLQRILAAALISASLAVPAQAAEDRRPASADEISHVLQIASAADKDPVAVMSSADWRWFQKWSDEVPDYSFGPDKAAFWLMNGAAKGEFRRVAFFQHAVSSAAYQLQHHIQDPRKSPADFEAKTIAGLEGVLRAYETMLPTRPEIRSAALDAALAARDKNALAQFVAGLPPMPAR